MFDSRSVVPTSRMRGQDHEETLLLRRHLDDAVAFLKSFAWCRGIEESHWGAGVGGVVAIFLFRIDPGPSVDAWLWVVVGDLPSCYLVTDEARTPTEALEAYCCLMEAWIAAIRSGGPLGEVFPVAARPTQGNAAALESRLASLRGEVMPFLRAQLADRA